ncbi:TonB-dependent receptor plug domain-containing protein [Novosphingobium lindaniclasticum]|uniref:TonB-dependent receptor plug domain-containing protein n=1 Tax=Novosphingobium lindaniclasticum TaxID=1329895 RepID=UPI0024098DE5|nr:TonB-dependent receptor [Novosphingobium lindaniclasticum]
MRSRCGVLTSAALAAWPLASAQAQSVSAPPTDAGSAPAAMEEGGEEFEIVVAGQKPRGSVVGDIAPEVTFDSGDVRALGVSSVTDLLAELAPQTESAGGGAPVVLLEGRRIASFREVGTIPTEAIQRVEILPEEVALKYGYAATQKVVNIVLRQRFRAFTAEGGGKLGTRGDGLGVNTKGDFLAIRRGERVNIDANYSHGNAITEAQRGLATSGGDGRNRTLAPESEAFTLTGTWAKPLSHVWIATINGEATTTDTRALRGTALPYVAIPGGSPFAAGATDERFLPEVDGLSPLRNSNSTQTGHLGLTLNGTTQKWQWSFSGNYDRTDTRSIQQRPLNLADYAAAVAAGDPLADPSLPIAGQFLDFPAVNQTRNSTDSAELNFVATTSPVQLPAGAVNTTVKLSGNLDRSEGTVTRLGLSQPTSVGRDQGEASVSIDIPLSSRAVPLFPGAGRISLNANAAVRQIRDFGTLRTLGGGLTWNPTSRFSLIASYRDDQNAPSAAQLGGAILTTAAVDIFDYSRGQSVRVTALTGGNPDLRAASMRNFRLGGTFRLSDPNITLNLDYNRTWQRNQVTALPGATPAVLAAFPERFSRDADGELIGVDLRPINIASEDKSQLRMGITFTKTLKTPQSQIDAMRDSLRRRFPGGSPGRRDGQSSTPPPAGDNESNAPTHDGASPENTQANPAPALGAEGPREGGGRSGGFGGRGFGRGGFGGGGARGGRLTFSLYHTWVFSDRVVLREGQPEIDLLDGGTIGASSGGTPRHKLELQSGYSQGGLGLRLTGSWQSGTTVNGIAGFPTTQLRFDDFAKFDLRLFADLGQQPKLVDKIPFLRGSRLTFSVANLLDSRQRVRDGNGATPFAYSPYYLDPVGRAFQVTFRKLFFTAPPPGQRPAQGFRR